MEEIARYFEEIARRLEDMASRLDQLEATSAISYAKGNFVPTLVGLTTAGTFTYNAGVTLVEWTRIGNRVYFNGRLAITAIPVAATGIMTIQGFPYAGIAFGGMGIAGGGAMITWQANIVAGYTQVEGQIGSGVAYMTLVESGDNVGAAAMLGGEIIATSEFRFHGNYRVA